MDRRIQAADQSRFGKGARAPAAAFCPQRQERIRLVGRKAWISAEQHSWPAPYPALELERAAAPREVLAAAMVLGPDKLRRLGRLTSTRVFLSKGNSPATYERPSVRLRLACPRRKCKPTLDPLSKQWGI